MTTKISSREVLSYLNELGYNNINAQQLKEFMKDLKKLIKYEERKRLQEEIQSEYIQEYINEISPIKENLDAIFSNLHSQQTVASKAKIKPKRENIIHVHIKRTKTQPHDTATCPRNKENTDFVENKEKHDENPVTVQNAQIISERLDDGDHVKSVTSSRKTSSKRNLNKPKASFIRPPVQINLKSDPVALYHYYQQQWKKAKIPGEDNRADLRWTIREKMMQGPRI